MTMKQARWMLSMALSIVVLAGCGGRDRSSTITIKGSDTMVILGQRWAEAYMAGHQGAVVQVTGGGSGTGIAALINGTTDICQSSRPMKQKELEQMQEKFGAPAYEVVVAKDGLAVYLHEQNPVKELSIGQLKAIYTAEITNWKQVGGPDQPITVYGRENSSGTYEYFKEHVLEGADFASQVQTLPGTAAVVNAVSQDPNGIGYGGAAYAKGVFDCAIKATDDAPAVLPNEDTVRDGSYPISRGLYYYMRQAPDGAAKAFIDFVLSPEGQKVVTAVGYFPVG
jgi:phosphate transport system substrate-binding protein